MKKIKVYKNVQDYLSETERALEEHELANNLILGMCYEIRNKTKENPEYHFVNVWQDKKWIASAIKISGKILVGGRTKDKEDLKLLADYYKDNAINSYGIFGEIFYVEAFRDYFRKKIKSDKKLLAHQLSKINKIILAEGHFELAIENDHDVICDFMYQFQEELDMFPKRTEEEWSALTYEWIDKENLYIWKNNNAIVSVSAIVRKTKHLVMIGYVYTPKHLRGKGYATSCVEKLSDYILKSGYNYCGLFTERYNPTSNKIYKQIGYEVSTEFSDIEFA